MAEMPTGGNGYLYGYFDYTLTNTGDITIHGWYYESQFNTPIDVEGSGTASLEELSVEKELIKVVDLLGREVQPEPNKVLIYIYSDGTIERKIQIK